ncbi:MAG: hypothetical protein AAGG44_11815 [Planctomycetota bacterium]
MSTSIEPREEPISAVPSVTDCHQDHPSVLDWRLVLAFVVVGCFFYFAY